MKSGKTNIRVRERAALAAGSLCLGDRDFPHRRTLLESFIELAQDIKDMELHFSIGEALVFCSLGVRCPAALLGISGVWRSLSSLPSLSSRGRNWTGW